MPTGPTWAGRYSADFNHRTTLDTQLNVFESFRPKLPASWQQSPYVFLANIDPVLQLGVLDQDLAVDLDGALSVAELVLQGLAEPELQRGDRAEI